MKTDRRHELQTNELARWLGQNLERVKPYGMTILAVAIGVVVLGILWSVWSSRSRQSEQDAWARYELLTSGAYGQERMQAAEKEIQRKYKDDKRQLTPAEQDEVRKQVSKDIHEAIGKLAEEYKKSSLGCFAAVTVADDALLRGVDALFDNRPDDARASLDTAAKFYQQVIDNADDPMLLARGQLGLARTLETRRGRDERDPDAHDAKVAASTYEKLRGVDYYSDTAQRRIAALKGETPSGDFYKWFDGHLKSDQEHRPFGEGFGFPPLDKSGSDSIFDPDRSGPKFPEAGGTGGTPGPQP